MTWKVLIVDDDISIRLLLRTNVDAEEEFDVVGEAGNGEQALEMVARLRPDLVIMDHMMPRMSGEEAAPRMREVVPDIAIVAYSAALKDEPRWADAYVGKEQFADLVPLLRQLAEREPG